MIPHIERQPAIFATEPFASPRSVFATTSAGTLGLEVEDTAIAAFCYDDGMIAEIAIEIYGTEGAILLGGVDIASRPAREQGFLRIFRRDDKGGRWLDSPTVPHFKTGIFHEHLAWAFMSALEAGTAMPVTLEDGIRAQMMIDAAYRSAVRVSRSNRYPENTVPTSTATLGGSAPMACTPPTSMYMTGCGGSSFS